MSAPTDTRTTTPHALPVELAVHRAESVWELLCTVAALPQCDPLRCQLEHRCLAVLQGQWDLTLDDAITYRVTPLTLCA